MLTGVVVPLVEVLTSSKVPFSVSPLTFGFFEADEVLNFCIDFLKMFIEGMMPIVLGTTAAETQEQEIVEIWFSYCRRRHDQ